MIPRVPKALTLSGLAAVFAAGLVLAVTLPVGGGAADTTTTTTAETTTADTTTTAETTTVETTTTTLPAKTITIETTTTKLVPVTPAETTTTPESTSSGGNGTEAWVWVLLGILAAGLIAMIVLFATRNRDGGGGLSPDDRLRRLDGAVASWAAQGWAVETQTADSAVLRRGAESMLVSVDPGGHVSTRPLAEPPPQQSGGDWPGGSGDP